MKYTKERVDIIIDHLRKVGGRYAAASAGDISFETFCRWMEKPEFKKRVTEAEKTGIVYKKEYAINAIFNAMKKDWKAAAWWLERTFPESFGKTVKVQGDIATVKPEDIKELRSVLNELDTTIKKPHGNT